MHVTDVDDERMANDGNYHFEERKNNNNNKKQMRQKSSRGY